MTANDRMERIRASLDAAFDPVAIEVVDDSAQHAGHAGSSGAGETHYSVTLVSQRFAGMGRLARSRSVHQVLEAEFGSGLHALALTLRSPGEAL